MSRGAASQLARTDLERIIAFLAAVADLEFERPYPPELVVRLSDLVPATHVVYRENATKDRRTTLMVDGDGAHVDDADELYWSVGPCAITQYRNRTRDLTAARLSDVVEWRRYRETPVYLEYFRLGMVDHMLDVGLQVGAGWQRSFLYCRQHGERDFTERDRAVLEVLRPHFEGLEAEASLRRQLARARRATDEPGTDGRTVGHRPAAAIGDRDPAALTAREREIVGLVAVGKTNAEIAAELWITPGTVKTHLEHVYGKLGVGRRSAVRALTRASALTREIGRTATGR